MKRKKRRARTPAPISMHVRLAPADLQAAQAIMVGLRKANVGGPPITFSDAVRYAIQVCAMAFYDELPPVLPLPEGVSYNGEEEGRNRTSVPGNG
jgi:hypothetical protein